MKLAKRDIAILLILAAVLVVFAAYRFSFATSLETISAENQTQEQLNVQISALEKEASKEPEYDKENKAWKKAVDEIVAKYDAAYRYEDGILYMNKLETKELTMITSYNVGETQVISSAVGSGEFEGATYTNGSTGYSFSYVVKDYETLKKFIDELVSGNDGVKTLESMTYSINRETGEISGNVTMTVYSMTDGKTDYVAPSIEGVTTGNIVSIFGEIIPKEETEE